MKIDVKKQVVDLDGCQIYYPELKQTRLFSLILYGETWERIICLTKTEYRQDFLIVLEGGSIKYFYDDEDKFEKFLHTIANLAESHIDMAYNVRRYYYLSAYEGKYYTPSEGIPSKEAEIKLRLCVALAWKLKRRYGQLPNWVKGDFNLYEFNDCKEIEFIEVGNLQEAYNLLNSVLPDNRRATEKRLIAEQAQKDKEEREQRQNEVDAGFEKRYGSIPKLKAELIEWAHSDPGIYEANQKYNECEKARKQVLQNQPINEIENRYSDYDNNYNYYDYNAFLERGRKIAERRKKENEERELQKVLQETAKAPYLEFYSKALICVKLYFHEIYDFYHGIEDERYRLPDDWDVQKALNYLCDAPTYPIARMKFYGAPSTREVDETIAEKRKTALQKYIQSMRMLFAQKGDFRDGEIPEQKKELVDWRDRKEPFQLALKKYFEYKENFEYVERVVSDAKLEEIKEAFADYLEFYQNAKVFISDYLNEINRKKDARKEIPQEDLDRALMYFYNTDSPEEAREAVKEKKYRESRQYGEKGEEEVEYALKWLVGDYIKLEKDASGKYGTKAIVLNNKDFVDEPQEFDHIVIGPQGVFNIETKNYTGKIIIDRDGNWIREQSDGRKVGERNPLQQSRRHEAVLRSIVGDDVPIISILAIANPKAIIQGAENSKVKLLKSDVLEEYISNYKGAVSYTKEKIQALADEIEKYRVSK